MAVNSMRHRFLCNNIAYLIVKHTDYCIKSALNFVNLNGPVYKTNLVWTKFLSDHGPDQIELCKQYLSVPKIWSGPGPKRDLLMCKDHSLTESGPVPNLDM